MAGKLNVADRLSANLYHADETHSHIIVNKENIDPKELDAVIRGCPAALYSTDENGNVFFEHLGCLECGTCKVLSEGKIVKDWQYPYGGKGVQYRQG